MARVPERNKQLKVELTKVFGDDDKPYKRYTSPKDIDITFMGNGSETGTISNLAVTVFKPFRSRAGDVDPYSTVVVSFDLLEINGESSTDPTEEKAPSIFISFSTNQEVHPDKTTPLIKMRYENLHIYSEHKVSPILFYETNSEELKAYFQITEGALYR
ncbi:hypothetical protein COF67_22245 [Bacillus toyonensis]|uniref:hypothetical protein n=1 Tax=Bacillus toyonensis TaxID=155322 RepID=UPI000BFCE010|nr:hypothetical protein [Bacillus toyonensis]PHD46570.1 hypothetical protein COF67_22245 [Bacillus toyonensis]